MTVRAVLGYRLPDRLLLACRLCCCRTTLVAGTSGSATGSGFARPRRSRPRLAPPFCPFGAAAAASPRADPVRGRVAPAGAVAGAEAGRDVLVRPLAPADAPAVAGLADAALRVPLAAGLAEPVGGLADAALRVPLAAGLAATAVLLAAPEPEPAAGLAAPDAGRAAVAAVARAEPPVAAAV